MTEGRIKMYSMHAWLVLRDYRTRMYLKEFSHFCCAEYAPRGMAPGRLESVRIRLPVGVLLQPVSFQKILSQNASLRILVMMDDGSEPGMAVHRTVR